MRRGPVPQLLRYLVYVSTTLSLSYVKIYSGCPWVNVEQSLLRFSVATECFDWILFVDVWTRKYKHNLGLLLYIDFMLIPGIVPSLMSLKDMLDNGLDISL